jgi:tetratricopeptide (TPR) repeat protein
MRTTKRLLVVLAWASLGQAFVGCGGDVTVTDVPAPPSAISDPDLARLLSRRTARVRSSPASAEAWGQLALAYDAHAFPERALMSYERAAALDPERFDWPYLHATVLTATDQVAALEWLDQAVGLRDDYAPLFTRRGLGRHAVGELVGARADLERAVELDDRLVAAHLGLAKVALDEGRDEEARAHAAQAVQLGPGSDEPYAVLALAQQRLGDDEAAAQSLAEVDDGGRREPLPDALRAQVGSHGVTTNWIGVQADNALARGDVKTALKLWQGARASKPGDVAVLIGHSLTLRAVGQGGEARATLEEARDTLRGRGDEADRGQCASVAYGLGLDSLARGDLEAAKSELDEALAFDPDLAAARGYRGVAALMTDDRGRGLELLRSAVDELGPEHVLQVNLATALVDAEQWHEAREVLDRCLAAGAPTGQMHFLQGRALGGLGEFRLSAESFGLAAKLEPANENAHSNRARALAKLGEHAEAANAYQDMCDSFPGSARAKQRRAWFLATTPDEAVVDGPTALTLAGELLGGQPNDAELLSLAAAAAAAAGNFREADERETEAIERLGAMTLGAGMSVEALRSAMVERREAYRAGRRWVER